MASLSFGQVLASYWLMCCVGGVVDSAHQPLILQLMVLTPEDVSKVRFGRLSVQAICTLRLLKEAFGVTFKITEERTAVLSATAHDGRDAGDNTTDEEEDEDENETSASEDINEEGEEEESSGSDAGSAEEGNSAAVTAEEGADKCPSSRSTFLLTCLGIGYVNTNRKAT
jgi:hypothetical protein